MKAASPLELATHGAAIVLAPDLGTLAVTGKDRASWLNGLVTCDVTKVRPGHAQYGLFVVKIGRILADAWLVDGGGRLLVAVPRPRVAVLREHLERYLMMEDAAHEDASDAWSWAHVHGPEAARVAADLARGAGGFAGAFDLTGLGGAVVAAPAGTLEAACARTVGDHVALVGDAGWDEIRVARGIGRFGVDFGDTTYPQEASLEKVAVSFQKGCYLGQEVVCRLEMRGHVTKKLVSLAIEGDLAVAPGAEVVSGDGAALGTVSTAARAGDGPRALAMLKFASTEPGTKVRVAGRDAVVVAP